MRVVYKFTPRTYNAADYQELTDYLKQVRRYSHTDVTRCCSVIQQLKEMGYSDNDFLVGDHREITAKYTNAEIYQCRQSLHRQICRFIRMYCEWLNYDRQKASSM